MVQVKRGGKWVTVKPGEKVGSVSVPKTTTTKKSVYIPIDYVSRDPKTGQVDIQQSAPVYERGGTTSGTTTSDFVRTGTTTTTGTGRSSSTTSPHPGRFRTTPTSMATPAAGTSMPATSPVTASPTSPSPRAT